MGAPARPASAPDANRPGHTQNWNLSVQYQLPKETVLEVAYIGNKGTRFFAGPFNEMNGNPSSMLSMGDTLLDPVSTHPELIPYANFPTDLTVAQALRKYPQYGSVQEFFPYNSSSLYNSLQIGHEAPDHRPGLHRGLHLVQDPCLLRYERSDELPEQLRVRHGPGFLQPQARTNHHHVQLPAEFQVDQDL